MHLRTVNYMSSPIARFYAFESIIVFSMTFCIWGLQWQFFLLNPKILDPSVTAVLIDLHRFILSLLDSHHLYILNQRLNAPNPFAAALQAPGDGDFNNKGFASHDALSFMYYHATEYIADSTSVFHAQ